MARRPKSIHALIFISILVLSGCAAGKAITAAKIGPPDSDKNVLIATQGSDFKDAVVSNLVDALEKENIAIEIMDLKYLPKIKANAYNAIVILNDYKFFHYNSKVRRFLKNASYEDKEKVLLLTTAGSPHRMKEMAEVDAISAASKMDDSLSISDIVIEKVNTILTVE